MTQILLAEDDEIMRITVEDRLRKQGWQVDSVENGRQALEMLEHRNYHLLLSDVRMPGLDGLELLKRARANAPFTDLFMMTAYGSVDDAVACLKQGAADYILKPFDMDDLVIRINRILEHQQVKARCASLEDRCHQEHQPIIGNSREIGKVLSLIAQIGPSDSNVLITGESGTGKELAASAIHMASPRADKPYIRINCAAIPDGLIESELFGHEKGAFTGAHARKQGRFEMADGGTLLLDEIGDLPMGLQAKLLRVLQEGECERVGGTRTVKVDVRVLCSTAKNLDHEAAADRFRKDLLYRLSVIPLVMPPLRNRLDDVPVLANHFLHEFSIKRGVALTLSAEALNLLLNYEYPGNVRELKNIIERASVLSPAAKITAADLPSDLNGRGKAIEESGPLLLSQALASAERRCILDALTRSEGNRTRASELLGISRKNLWEKMKLHRIEV